jgi:hypothetical protein
MQYEEELRLVPGKRLGKGAVVNAVQLGRGAGEDARETAGLETGATCRRAGRMPKLNGIEGVIGWRVDS